MSRGDFDRVVHLDTLVSRLRKHGAIADVAYRPFGWEIAIRYGSGYPFLKPAVYWGTDGSGEIIRVAVVDQGPSRGPTLGS